MKNTISRIIPLAIIMFLTVVGCEKFLAQKPDKQLATPRDGKDLQAMLDYVSGMNYNLPIGVGVVGSDDLFLSDDTWNSISPRFSMEYSWEKIPLYNFYWSTPYRAILSINTVLDELDNVRYQSDMEKRQVKGTALFLRAYMHFHIAQIFAAPYHSSTLDMPGIPVRTTSNINVKVGRGSISHTYELILKDFLQSCRLLDAIRPSYPTRPYKASAYAGLARCYLSMGNYTQAGLYADSCLQLQHEMMDFGDFELPSALYPFEKFNPEIVFYSQMTGNGGLAERHSRVDTFLYHEYNENDYRKQLFFTPNADGYFAFTGDYAQSSNANKFNGLTTTEMLLIRIESRIRENLLEAAMQDINLLISHRYQEPYPTVIDKSKSELLNFVLSERRKELLFRGTRWSDIRRLSFEDGRAIDLIRKLNGETLVLASDKIQRFAYFIPQEVIDRGQIYQNQ